MKSKSKIRIVSAKFAVAVMTLFFFFSNANAKTMNRTIRLSGLVVDAQSMLPVAKANIYASDKKLLGSTDKNGYYNITISYEKRGEIRFAISIQKEGYNNVIDKEHWGDLGNNVKMVMYFAMCGTNSTATAFSKFGDSSIGGVDLDYSSVLKGFDAVKRQKKFDDALAKAKEGNENAMLQVEDKFYLVNSSGWIQLNSDQDIISVNGEQKIAANKINTIIKRQNIRGMTPLESSSDAQFEIYTK